MIRKLLKYDHSDITLKPNKKLIPVTLFKMNDDGMKKFNDIYKWVLKQNFKKLQRSNSGGISYEIRNFKPPMYDINCSKACVELTLILYEGMFRFQFRTSTQIKTKNEKTLFGWHAWLMFKEKCAEFSIDIDDYAINNGSEIKESIESPLIKLYKESFKNKIFTNTHHIDFHSSYPAGLINTHPEFKDVITWIYENRNIDDQKWKFVLNASIGYMQSEFSCKARWAHLSRDAIKNNNDRLKELSQRLINSGRVVLLYNTDGLWYTGDIYHGKGEGVNIGEWQNDHINCKFRAKSAGSYEYIENNIYTPVVRGETKLDLKSDRKDWKWGDIYLNEAEPLMYSFNEKMGVVKNEQKI